MYADCITSYMLQKSWF